MKIIRAILIRLGIALAALLLAPGGNAADFIVSLSITVTNQPTNGASLTVNAATRTWSANVTAPATQVLVATNGAFATSATNLFSQIASYSFAGPLALSFSSSNVVTLRAPLNTAIAASLTGPWATLTLATNSAVTNLTAVRVPLAAEAPSVRANVADQLVKGISDYAQTNAFPAAANALSNFVNRVTDQVIGGAKTWTGSNAFNGGLSFSNGVNRGSAFSSPGTATGSEQLGSGATATGPYAIAVGRGAGANATFGTALGNFATANSGTNATALGSFATATGQDATAVGNTAAATGGESIGLGKSSSAAGTASIVVGSGASDAGFSNVVVVGKGATAATNNEVVLGSSAHRVRIPGTLASPTITGASVQANSLIASNAVNLGAAFTSPGSAPGSEQLGTNTTASGTNSIAAGNGAIASGTRSAAYGFHAQAGANDATGIGPNAAPSGIGSVAVGASSATLGASSTALGTNAVTTGARSVALGADASDGGKTNSAAIGPGTTSTDNNEITLGTTNHTTRISGATRVGKQTSTALANGANAAVTIGAATYFRVTPGPSAAFSVAGIAGGSDGRLLVLHNVTGQQMTLSNESGTDPTPANRITTGTGADLVSTNASVALLIYDSATSRWIVAAFR